MLSFLQRHAAAVMGHLTGWDRLRFRGTLRMLANVTGLSRLLCYRGMLLKDFRDHAHALSQQVRAESLAVAERADRPIVHLTGPSIPKEDQARLIAQRDGIRGGLIAVLTAVEPCWSYNIQSDGNGRLELIHAYRKCQHLYHYLIHPVFGFMHLRLQTWLPFNLHVCVNGREWLSRQLDAAGVGYRRVDNCFTHIDDLKRAQRLMDRQVSFDYAKALGALAEQVNPAHRSIVGDYDIPYYWSLDQSEWATDVMFRSSRQLAELYPSRHAACDRALCLAVGAAVPGPAADGGRAGPWSVEKRSAQRVQTPPRRRVRQAPHRRQQHQDVRQGRLGAAGGDDVEPDA
jgi:hypothetical protein